MPNTDFHNRETLADKPDPYVGRRIENRWRVVGRLGGGGFGDVYLAEDERLDGRRTVVKFLRPDALADPIARVKFDDERRALARLSELRHPGLGEIYGAGTLEDQTPYLVMQFIAGVSLENRLRERGTLSPAECADVVMALGDALAAVHGAGVIHRDVKPSNVMLSPEPGGGERVVLIDFGLARAPVTGPPDPNRPPTFGLGTLAYAAPEQFSPTARLTPTCDVYALAATAYQLLTGRPPFPTRPNVDLHAFDADRRNGLAAAARAHRPEISAAADALLTAALAYEPERRPAGAGRFGADLAAALRADGAPGRRVEIPVGPAARGAGGGWKLGLHRRRVRAGLGALALVCALGGYAAWRRASEPAPRTNPPPAVTDAPAAPASEPEREVSYAMEIQRMRNGKPEGAPYFGTGRETFASGYQFRLILTPPADGELYVFAEGANERGARETAILFPTPKRNGGSAGVKAGRAVETGKNTFGGGTGDETLYIVWSATARPELRRAQAAAFAGGGTLAADAAARLRDFLNAQGGPPPTDEPRGNGRVLRGRGDPLVGRIELKHQ